ncbi:serine/threonine protein kinase (Pdd7p), putative [Talaromyces stipitatus ATCC 10500]|uniref:Serine/threonine-protein kinase ATG1 n=1 Tax=Talaromyces stipitatus (strain ATCC 10500 / CBS 375.48 / QM 6759 / NRRL 1006) TaxID=441959 RepID=B8ME78_TALSN|nr:serine/threonine protein kinase (Pdd7p), putative [Talaromyces stipitatus ATCC 10500]EED16505.1 serine/threonine protein kinase (Pdd7p), putative [Talaromyces stipitatus ATCC 10500]
MASAQPVPAPVRRNRDASHAEVPIGRYIRLEQIGRGSFATVYQGVHAKHRSYVAIKSVNLSKLNKKLKENLWTEIDILKGLHHPHIVALIDCQESTSHIHLVMEYCALGDLSLFIKRRDTLRDHRYTRDMIAKYPNPRVGALNEVVVRHFLKQLSSALKFLRDRNLIHRDIKPQNLLLCPSPSSYRNGGAQVVPFKGSDDSFTPLAGLETLPMLKIADFGFARSLPSTSLAETLCGSPLYMAPEILRYEKYDAKADLWSVGTVLYEMVVGKPPFMASNHVELLRRIERHKDKIRFPDELEISADIKSLIRSLLKMNPIERMNFPEFFDHIVIQESIPGLVGNDLVPPARSSSATDQPDATPLDDNRFSDVTDTTSRQGDVREPSITQSPLPPASRQSSGPRADLDSSPRPESLQRTASGDKLSRTGDAQRAAGIGRRPGPISHVTAPGRQELVDKYQGTLERQPSRNSHYPSPVIKQEEDPTIKDERERAAQDIAFERDYVLVEKRAVEVNAFADELANSPRIAQPGPRPSGGIVRRATVQNVHSSNNPPASPKAIQFAGRARADSHTRQSSFERRYGQSPSSATSAISKALNMASGRLFGVSFSPPIGKGGRSPPLTYNPYPTYPAAQYSLLMAGDGTKTNTAMDEDAKTVQYIEDCATRSDVVYGFAEVKYKQLIPLTPSVQTDLDKGGDQIFLESDDGELTPDAVVTLSEEALVLYVKALALLAKSMDIAGAWWVRKNRGEVFGETSHGVSTTSDAVGTRINNVVQWVRSRFNEVLEKAEFVRLKLIEGQKRLPPDHPSHPSNHSLESNSAGTLGTSADHVVVSSGVTAEKLMYDRALEMSRAAAINELTGEDLPGCELAYMTAIRMLEAILESDELSPPNKSGDRSGDPEKIVLDGVQVEDRKVVSKLVSSIRSRRASLRKKMTVMAKHSSTPLGTSPGKVATTKVRPASPAIAGVSPPR